MRRQSSERLPARTLGPDTVNWLAEFEEHLNHQSLSAEGVHRCLGVARHFLLWLELEGILPEAIDSAAIRGFRDHKCICPPREERGGLYKLHAPPPRSALPRVHRFVQFLEGTGRTAHPGELQHGYGLVDQFLEWAARQGHTPNMLVSYGQRSRHLLVWLHGSRIPMKAVTVEVLQRYFEHDCICPGDFNRFKNSRAHADTVFATNKFVRYLANRGMVPDVHIARKKPLNPDLQAFHTWLRQHRGISELTVREYDREVSSLLVDLGNNPTTYDAVLVRQVLLSRFAGVSRNHARRLVYAIRMYLRFLSSKGQCPAALVGAVPRTGLWSLATLPRYLSMDEVEKVIAACDGTRPVDIRNRAILLLLARLGLRAGDVRFLQLNDIDWDNAELHVCGKSRRSVRLPLPQDAGDALLAYIEQTRPRVNEQTVFLRSRAPYRPFAYSTTISRMVHHALQRAGVNSPNGQGAHIFRHSAATGLLRSGASRVQVWRGDSNRLIY